MKVSLHQDLPVYKAGYDLLIEIFQFTKEFSKENKYSAGESLKKETIKFKKICSGKSKSIKTH